jgi:hypothetical protein
MFAQLVLARLPPEDRASLAGVGRVWRAAVYPEAIFPNLSPARDDDDGRGQGLTLVHFSAQPESFLTQNTP